MVSAFVCPLGKGTIRGDCSLNRESITAGKDAYAILSEIHTILSYHGNGHYRYIQGRRRVISGQKRGKTVPSQSVFIKIIGSRV